MTGSANFSDASTTRSDENKLVIREWASSQRAPAAQTFKHLDVTDKWWPQYFGDTDRSRQRQYFAGAR